MERAPGAVRAPPSLAARGANSSGRITLPTDATVAQGTCDIVVGQGGEVKTDGTTATGGAGYGSEGNSAPGPRDNPGGPAGAGVGGNTLLLGALGGTPHVASGGGGGSAVRETVQGSTQQTTVNQAPDTTTGFNYGTANARSSAPNGRVGAVGSVNSTAPGLTVNPATAADGSVGGTRGGTARLNNAGGSFAASAGGEGMVGSQFTGTTRLTISTGTGAAGSSYRVATALGTPISNYALAPSGLLSIATRGRPQSGSSSSARRGLSRTRTPTSRPRPMRRERAPVDSSQLSYIFALAGERTG